MAEDSHKLIAATLAAAVLSKTDITDATEATKEVMRYYRVLLRRVERLHSPAETGAEEG
jgi:hypothetical protein